MCEACAKHCHKSHPTVEIGLNHSFVCGCGKNHFTDNKDKRHCSVEFVGEMKVADQPVCYQHFYRCMDCCPSEGKYICRGCAENCHKDHNVVDCGVQKGFCHCGTKQLGKEISCKSSYFVPPVPGECSCGKSNYPTLQRWFQCMTCGLYGSDSHGVCWSCAQQCHKDHLTLDRGVKRRKCECQETNNCQLSK